MPMVIAIWTKSQTTLFNRRIHSITLFCAGILETLIKYKFAIIFTKEVHKIKCVGIRETVIRPIVGQIDTPYIGGASSFTDKLLYRCVSLIAVVIFGCSFAELVVDLIL